MAITDLTGTTWKFDCSTITIDLSEFFAIDGTLTAGGYSATSVSGGTFGLRSGWSLTFPNEGSSSPRFYCNVSSDPYLRYYAEDGTNFTVDTNCTLYISGGADATNPALIAWLSENGELQEQTKTIIKAGTYRLNSTLTAIGFWDTYLLHNIYFIDSNGMKTSLSGLAQIHMDSKYLGIVDAAGGTQYIYNFDTNTYMVDYPCGFYLPEDVESESWYTWFVENTERCIPKGTYIFNDTPDIPDGTNLSITFTSNSGDIATFSIEGNDNMTGMTVIGANEDGQFGAFIQYLTGLTVYGNAYIYANPPVEGQTNGWIYPCQTVTFTEDVYTDNKNVEWFSANTERVEENVIKAGTYRFNETLTAIPATIQLPYEFHFSNGGEGYTDIYLANNVLQWRAGEGSFVNNVYNYETQTWEYDSERVIIVDTPQTVSKDFYTWFNENIPSASTTAKKFVRLYLGDVAYSSGGKCFKRLTAEEPSTEI